MDKLEIKKLSFSKKPIPIPAEYRPMYKIALIVLILKLCCRGMSSNLLKLHLFSWALTTEKNMTELRNFVLSNFTNDFSIWGIEPTLNRALQFALAERICELEGGKIYKLGLRGEEFYKAIAADEELFSKEKEFLLFIGKNKITDKRISFMTQNWKLFYAEN